MLIDFPINIMQEINTNFESIKFPNLFFCGEALDINGYCGGYNLMFAFISAKYVADYISSI